MTTRTRDTAPPGKEKRGTSPSPHTGGLTQQRTRRSLNSSTTNSPAPTRDPTTTRPEKPIPNYLKTTVSSRLEAASNSKQQGKKPALNSTTDTAQNPTLMRRRSFDKPPPRAQISRVSACANPPLRSSSFSGRTVSTQKPVLEKNLRGTKDNAGKQHSLYARPVSSTVKKSGVHVKKQETGSSSSGSASTTKERVINVTEKVDNLPNNVPEPKKPQPEIQEVFVTESEEEKEHVEDNDEKGGKDLVAKDQEPVKIEQAEPVKIEQAEPVKDVKIVSVELPIVLEEDTSIVVKTEEETLIKEININKDELKENTVNLDQSIADSPNEEVQEKVKAEEEEEEETGSGNEAPEAKETEAEEVVVVEEKKKEEKIEVPSKPKVQVAPQAKRDAVSNDVIEETASKLREQRKNKVRALAGAFETVISLQDK